jgi:hypothetical protein
VFIERYIPFSQKRAFDVNRCWPGALFQSNHQKQTFYGHGKTTNNWFLAICEITALGPEPPLPKGTWLAYQ